MHKKRKLFFLVMTLILTSFLMACQKEEVASENTEVKEKIEKNESTEEVEVEKIDEESKEESDDFYTVSDLSEIDTGADYFDESVKKQVKDTIEINWEGKEKLPAYKKAYFEEYLYLKHFFERNFDAYKQEESPLFNKTTFYRKGYIEDLDKDNIPEMILLVDYPIEQGHKNLALVYSFDEEKNIAKNIYRYEDEVVIGQDYSLVLELGMVKGQPNDQLYIFEELTSMHTAENEFSFIEKTVGEDKVIVTPTAGVVGEIDFETGIFNNFTYRTSDLFEKFLAHKPNAGTDFEPKYTESDEVSYLAVRDKILGQGTKVVITDYEETVELDYQIDNNNNLIYENYDYKLLTEEDFVNELLSK